MNAGKITIITGPMFSGKTTVLMNEYDKVKNIGIPIIFKPAIDERYSTDDIVTHDSQSRQAINCRSSTKIFEYLEHNSHCITDVFIDEIQFFDSELVEVVEWCRDCGFNVFLAGLNQDYLGKPFYFADGERHVGELLCIADEINYLTARCQLCGAPATKTHLKNIDDATMQRTSNIILGSDDKYEARCYKHHKKE